MPALPLPAPLGGSAVAAAYQVDANGTHDALQVICAWPVSGQYGPGTRVLYYVLIATCLLAKNKEWLVNPCLAAALVLPAVAAIHGIVLAVMHNPSAVDMDIFGAFQLCSIGILAAPVTVMMSKTYFNDPGRNTIFVWAFLLLVGLLSMTVEFYRINTVDCILSGEPVSSRASLFDYKEGNNCGLTCSTASGPSSPTRGGSANNIYVIPAPDKLTFGASTLLAAACCIHTILCLVSMWDKVLEINWRRRFGREPESDDEAISGTNGATRGIMKNINETIGFFLKILAIPVFGGAGLAILIIGEINFFSPQVNYQTEPMANVGQWAPVAGTSLAMLGSLYLLLARDAKEAEKEASIASSVHHCNCSHHHLDDSSLFNGFSHSETSLPISHQTPSHGPRHSSSTHDLQAQLPDSGYRRRIARAFFRMGEFIGTPAEDFIEPISTDRTRVQILEVPGERFNNPNWSRVANEQDHQEMEEGNRSSRTASFVGSVTSSRRLRRSTTLPAGEAPQNRGQRPRSSTATNSRPTQVELQNMASSNDPSHGRPSRSSTLTVPPLVYNPS